MSALEALLLNMSELSDAERLAFVRRCSDAALAIGCVFSAEDSGVDGYLECKLRCGDWFDMRTCISNHGARDEHAGRGMRRRVNAALALAYHYVDGSEA